jgi:hypothetical protein
VEEIVEQKFERLFFGFFSDAGYRLAIDSESARAVG